MTRPKRQTKAQFQLCQLNRKRSFKSCGIRTSFTKTRDRALLYIDLHLVHEVTSPQAFEGLRLTGRKVRRPDLTLATMDHNVPTTDRCAPDSRPDFRQANGHAAPKLRRIRHHALRFGRRSTGHRSRHRAGTGHHATGHDHRLRRFAHLDARRVWFARVWHRHIGKSNTFWRRRHFAAGPPENDGNSRRRRAALCRPA